MLFSYLTFMLAVICLKAARLVNAGLYVRLLSILLCVNSYLKFPIRLSHPRKALYVRQTSPVLLLGWRMDGPLFSLRLGYRQSDCTLAAKYVMSTLHPHVPRRTYLSFMLATCPNHFACQCWQ